MDNDKKAAFVRAHKRQKFSKGGIIRKIAGRHYFDDGGTVLGGPGPVGGNNAPTVNNTGLTGTIGNALGLNNNFQAQGANIQQGTNAAQLNQAYQGAQTGLAQQQTLANQLQAQGAQGMNTQQALTGQLQGVIAGTGPNAAQTALNQNTGANVANQAALMAGQRGAGANAGLIAREAAMQGANIQQQAVGQAATLQAQQQIAAQQQLQGLAGTQIGQQAGAIQGVNNAQQNEQNILQGANTAANNAAVTMQSNINATNAAIAAANQQEAGNIVGGITGGIGGLLGMGGSHYKGGPIEHLAAGGPLQVTPMAVPQMASTPWVNSAPIQGQGPVGAAPMNFTAPTMGNSKSGADFGKAVRKSLQSTPKTPAQNAEANGAPSTGGVTQENISSTSDIPNTSETYSATESDVPQEAHGGPIHHDYFHAHFKNYFGGGESKAVPAMVSPGEVYLSPEAVHKVIHEGANPMKIGEKIGGKPKVKGDSLKNDTVPKTLEEGGCVIPRHIATHKMSAEKAELFVHRAMARKKARG